MLRLLGEGDISAYEQKKFYVAVRLFYVDAASEAVKKLPFDDSFFSNTRFLNVGRRAVCTFDAVEFFCAKYSN